MWPVDNYYLRPLNKGVCSLTILRSQQCIRIFSLWYYRVGTLINVGMLETTHEQVLESLFSGSLSHHLKEMPLLMKINVSFACDTKTCKIITILFFMHGRWKELEQRPYRFQNTDDGSARLWTISELLVTIFSGDQ